MAEDFSVAVGRAFASGGGAVASAAEGSCVARLAGFFPTATPVRLPVRVSGSTTTEDTVIEYGTAREVLFACVLPLEFGERLQLRNADGTFVAEAIVVAAQFHESHTAVAARFVHDVANWIVKS